MHVDFFAAVVTAHPDDADHAPLLKDPVHARVARAGDVVDGDLILAAVSLHGADYFNDQYPAHPGPYNPACQCGVCCHLIHEPGPVVVLSNGHPWTTCDPWLADALVLIIPAHPGPYNPACQCGVCCHLIHEPGPVVVLSNGHPWTTCDPWLADALVLIIPARPLPDRTAKE